MLFVNICGFAYDCEVDGIYYDLNTTNYTASVTYLYSGDYRGVVHIPEEIAYNGTTYSVTSIGWAAFSGCTSLISVTSLNTTPPTVENFSAFDSITEQNAILHVPAGCKGVYQQAGCWQNFVNIQFDRH